MKVYINFLLKVRLYEVRLTAKLNAALSKTNWQVEQINEKKIQVEIEPFKQFTYLAVAV